MKHGSIWTEWDSKYYTPGVCVYCVSINPYQMLPGYNKQGFYFLSCQLWQADAVCQSQTGIFPSHITWPVRKILWAKICPQLHSCNPVTSVACPQWHQQIPPVPGSSSVGDAGRVLEVAERFKEATGGFSLCRFCSLLVILKHAFLFKT